MEVVSYQPEHNPEAITNYCSDGVKTGRSKNPDVQDMILKAKKHLSAIGWSFFYVYKNQDRRELRYCSPGGRSYYSLRSACQSLVVSSKIQNPKDQPETKLEKKDDHSLSNNRPKKNIRMEDVENSYFQQQRDRSLMNNDPGSDENKRIEGKRVQDVERMMKSKKKKIDFKPKKLIRKAEGMLSTRKRCMLSLLIEKNIVLTGSRVSYCRKDGRVLAKGQVYDEGIRCDCCDELFLMSKFEAHAGSTYRRPAASLFLDDGRSLFDCQTQLHQENKIKSPKSSDGVTINDDFCSFCNDGGELVLCDSCTSSFHSTCIGLNTIPNSDYWFCPSCCCRICHDHQGHIGNLDQIKCRQCEKQFHIDCVTKLGFSMSNTNSDEWLCSESCERIHSGLNAISRKPVRLTVDSLSWRLLKLDEDEQDMNECTETYSRLNIALDVMHECFQPVKHRWSDTNLVEDLIFSRSSKRSNFTGFFTAVLEKDDEMITVATLRVHGCKVAEIPLVATRFRYRRLGMCRMLMDEIEKKLGELGVERVVLPAVPEMISTWTESFGFSVMTELERLDLVGYKFLDFPGTIKCHKMLK
ncbi:hypothetical protein L1987_82301 [Smallanthus sonchifolius]|uniref:Uncharacterized protein n=1 Tax=Smallanthus sonchifolius TaxID=185202 RepID=A0ACB8YBS9_9ASTR|nr:hypothetical protein L1987_82301 [Smallanthus sonchifolius]